MAKVNLLQQPVNKAKTPSSGDGNRLAQLPSEDGRRGRKTHWHHRLKRERPTCTERNSIAHEECGWKDGNSGDSARENCVAQKTKSNTLDSDRPSHGRRFHQLRQHGIRHPQLEPGYNSRTDGSFL